MAQEVELKLTLPEADQQRFLSNAVLRKVRRGSERLVNIYYDTPDLALHCNGIAVRLRQSKRRWLQTVKCAGTSNIGLSSRPEWEKPYAGEFDFSDVDDLSVRKRLDHLQRRLIPIFETNFQRTTWHIREDGTDLAVAFDRGSVVANGSVIGISEVEIELARGEADRIFALADRLSEHFSLTPGQWSKAERGYRLFLGTPKAPARATPIPLDIAMTPLAAFREIANSCIGHLQLNHEEALRSDDAEYIHQMRIALRRLRAAIRLFRPLLPPMFEERLLPPLHELMAALGKARDLDVLIGEIVNPVMTAMPLEPRVAALSGLMLERREAARRSAIQALRSPAYGRTLLLAVSLLYRLPAKTRSAMPSLADFADARLKRLGHKASRLAQAAHRDDPSSLHAVRIGIKRLRYALDFFSPLLPERRTAKLLGRLSKAQDGLGQLNDLANAGALLMDCADDDPGLREAVSLIGGWHAQRYSQLLAKAAHIKSTLKAVQLPTVN